MTNFVRVERPASGQMTSFADINLDRVNRIQVERIGGKVMGVLIFPEGEPNSGIMLEDESARVFLTKWDSHHTIERLNNEPTPGLIEVVGDLPMKK